jgi:hypothetical protein
MKQVYLFLVLSLSVFSTSLAQVFVGPSGIMLKSNAAMQGDLILRGEVQGEGWMLLNDDQTQRIEGNDHSIRRLSLQNPGLVELTGDLYIHDSIEIGIGLLNLKDQILTLSDTAYMLEPPTGRVTGQKGYIETVRFLTSTQNQNIGGMGITLSTPHELGFSQIRRGHESFVSDSFMSAFRYYDLIPTNDLYLVDLDLDFRPEETNGVELSFYEVHRSFDQGITWQRQFNQYNYQPFQMHLDQIPAGFRWAIFPRWADDPITWISLEGWWQPNDVMLEWVVKENGVDYYEVERSEDAEFFTRIGEVDAYKNGQPQNTYNFPDSTAALLNRDTLYYRIKAVQPTGLGTYSNVIAVGIPRDRTPTGIWVFPNPIEDEVIRFEYATQDEHPVRISLYSARGKTLKEVFLDGTNGLFKSHSFDASQLSPGYYYLNLLGGEESYHEKVVVK